MSRRVENAERLDSYLLDRVLYWDKVAQRLMHLLPLNAQQSSVGRILCQRLLSGKSFGLGDVCFVMWKDQLRASALQFVGGPRMGECYRGGFGVRVRLCLV